MNRTTPPVVVVIGAGIAGLAAAYRLAQTGISVIVLERAAAVGGRIRSVPFANQTIDLGAQFCADFYQATGRLINELQLRSDVQPIDGSAGIPRAGKLHQVWTNTVPLTSLISLAGKARLPRVLPTLLRYAPQLSLHEPHRAAALDTRSLAEYARAELSPEVLEYGFYPVLAGIFYWTPERTSQAMFFVLLRAGLRLSKMRLYTFRNGMAQLPEALAARVPVTLNADVQTVQPTPDGRYLITAQIAGRPYLLRADGVVVATTADGPPRLLPDLDAAQRAFFTAISYSSSAVTAIEVHRRLPAAIYGILAPRVESPLVAAINIESVRRPGAAAVDHDVLMVYGSGLATPDLLSRSDESLHAALRDEAARLVPAYAPGADEGRHQVYRWERALPEFGVGHFRRLAYFQSGAIERDGRIVYAGDYLVGPFIETAIVSGEAAAARLIGRL